MLDFDMNELTEQFSNMFGEGDESKPETLKKVSLKRLSYSMPQFVSLEEYIVKKLNIKNEFVFLKLEDDKELYISINYVSEMKVEPYGDTDETKNQPENQPENI